jgi:hypothetical protein
MDEVVVGGTERDNAFRLMEGLRFIGVVVVVVVLMESVKMNLETLAGAPSVFFARLLGVLKMAGSTFSAS